MDLMDGATRSVRRGDAGWFRGEVWLSELAQEGVPGGVEMASVHFAPGARTAWHAHPQGQLLHVVGGTGLVQSRGGEARLVRAGDTVRAEPGEVHWHGATAGQSMTHLAIQPAGTEWHEHVEDEGYRTAQRLAESR